MRMSNRRTLCAALLSLVLTGPALADESYPDQPERCIELSKVRDMKVISDQMIAFRTGVHRYQVNSLPYPCPGLRDDTPILYRTSLDRLCNVDVITVLEDTGFGYMPAASCGLGKFVPMNENEVKQLERGEKGRHK